MKKTIYHLVRKAVCLLCILAVTGSLAFAQSGITVNFKQTPLKEVLDYITSQSKYKFVYTDALNVNNYKVTIQSSNESLDGLFSKLFAGTGISWTIKGNQVILVANDRQKSNSTTPKKIMKISGIISEDGSNETIPGAAIKNITRNTITASDDQGNYTIDAQEGDILMVTCIGMADKQVSVGSVPIIDIVLKTDMITLEDVVVTGYQTLSKERATGSYAVVTSKKLENKLQPSLKSIMEGQSAGVVLTKDGSIEIRGVSTIQGVKEPLIVVDGYPLIGEGVGLESINPEIIENITILKDAVAASIYGARASNGVIVVTTKQAKKDSFSLNYKGTYSVTLKPDMSKLNLASVEDYMDAELDLYQQNPNSAWSSYSGYNKISDYAYLLMAKERGLMSAQEADAQIAALKQNNSLKQIEKYLLKPKQSQQHNLTLSSGTSTNQFISSLRYSKEYGNLVKNDNSSFIADINNTWKPTKWFTFRIISNINYSRSHSTNEQYTSFTQWTAGSRILPYTNLYDDNGNPTPITPVGQRRLEKYETYPGMKPVDYHPETDLSKYVTTAETLRLRLGGDINIKFFEFLNGSVGGSWIKGNIKNRTIADAESFVMRTAYNDGTSASNAVKHYIPEGGRIDENRGTTDSWVIRAQLNYNQSFKGDKHKVSVMAGSEVSKDTYEYSYMPTRLGYNPVSATYNNGFYPSDYNNNTNNMKGDMLFGKQPTYLGSISYGNNYGVRDNRFVSWYGNGSYEYNNRYILTGSVRLDLTNFFGTDPKYRYKPTWSVGGTWKLSNENFFSGLKDIFNRLNIRASYGVNGNISLSYTPYLILSVGSHNPTTGGVSYGISSYPNNQLRWERTGIFDVGLDASLFENRLNISFDYYNKKSTDLIVSDSIDETKGTTAIPQNVGGVTNQGFEITLNADVIKGKQFSWNSNLITSYNTSNVDYYNVKRAYFGSYATASSILVQGYPMNGFWGAKFAGLDNKGTALFYNHNGEKVEGGSLEADDAIYLGTYRPKVDMSWTNTFSYKNFDLSFMFIGKFGHKYRKDCFSGSNYNSRYVGQRWKQAGDEEKTIYPVLKSWNMDMFYFPYSDILVGNANYVKLRDLTLSYNLPKSVLKSIKLSSAKIYFQTRNLFYITAKGVDIDPETAELNASGTGAMTAQAYTSLQLRPEFYFGVMINL